MSDADALHTATVTYFREHAAQFDVKVQLATDLETTPIEDPTVEWPEGDNPYRTVARLMLPVQDAFDPSLQSVVEQLSFSPAHALTAHRPLGRFGRARMAVYTQMAKLRREEDGQPASEPKSLAEVMMREIVPASRAASEPRVADGARDRDTEALFGAVRRRPLRLALLASAGFAALAWTLANREQERL